MGMPGNYEHKRKEIFMKKYLSLLFSLVIVFSIMISPAHGSESSMDNGQPRSFVESYSGILSLLRTELVDAGKSIAEDDLQYNDILNQNVYTISLANGGYIEVNEKQEIVAVDNFEVSHNEKSICSIEDAITILETELQLDSYTLVEKKEFAEDYYRLAWHKQMNEYLNPFDSVYVLFDLKTMQLEKLKRYNFVAENTTPSITQSQALEIAMPYLKGHKNNEIRISYVRPNLDIENKIEPQWDTSASLAYIFKNEEVRVTVDAMTGEIVGLSEAAGAKEERGASAAKEAKCFGVREAYYAATRMAWADDGFQALGYSTSSLRFCSSPSDATAVTNFWNGNNNYGFFITCHANSSVLSDNGNFTVTSSSVPKNSVWNFVILAGCDTATNDTWSNAFGISNSSTNKAFIGFKGYAYFDDMYIFDKVFWNMIGKKPIKDCYADGCLAPGMNDTFPIFKGDSNYYGFV